MNDEIIWLIVFGGPVLLLCSIAYLGRPRRNRRVNLPKPMHDERDSIQTFRRMYGR
jgi:hypothetical protein